MHKPVAAALAAVIVVGLTVVLLTRLGAGAGDGAHAGITPESPTASAGTGGDATVAAPRPTAPEATAPDATSTTGTPSEGGTGGVESEVIPQAGSVPTSLADLLPTDAPSAGTYATAPADAEATGALAPGFPAQVIYVPDDATVRSSSITTNTGRSQAALDAVAPGPCDTLLIATRDWYARGGFTEHTTSETPEGAMLEFTRGSTSVAIATQPQAAGCSLVLHGVLTPGTAR